MVPSMFGRVHHRDRTPTNSVAFIGTGCAVKMILVAALRANVVSTFSDMGMLAGYGQCVMYFLALIPVVAMLLRHLDKHARRQRVPLIGDSVIGAVALGYLLYSSFIPMPACPVNVYG